MNPDYKLYHPKWFRMRMPIFWWVEKLSYTKFIARELTSLAVAYAAVLLTLLVWTLSRGEEAYARYLALLQSPPVLILHSLIFVAILFHTVTWLNLAPSALVVRVRHRQVPDGVVLAAHYLAWFAATALVIWFFLWS